jgi:hypothetical protein
LAHVRFLKRADLVVSEFNVERRGGLPEVVRFRRTDDGCADPGMAQHPGESHLSHADAALLSDVLHCVDDRFIER